VTMECCSKTYVGLHVKCLIFLCDTTKFRFSGQIFIEIPNIKFYCSLSVRAAVVHTFGQTDIMKLIRHIARLCTPA